jgi:hypothetical protein
MPEILSYLGLRIPLQNCKSGGLAKIPRREATPLNTSFYKEALIVLGAAGIVIPVFHRLHVSPVLGFMLVGLAVGPFGLASLAPYLPWLSAITISAPEATDGARDRFDPRQAR